MDGPTNITQPLTRFIGREETLLSLGALLAEERLVTVLGPPGTGKTRLSLEYVLRAGAPAGGAWFCDLTEARDPEGLLSAVSRVLGVSLTAGETPEDSARQLGYAVSGRGEVLLILDNFEQIVAHAPAILGRWLLQAPRARFLVTSREKLRIEGEICFALYGLSEKEAAKLFVGRAKAAKQSFSLAEGEEEVVLAIVRRLDLLPLAIELAAARIALLPPRALLSRLDKRFTVLGGTRRDASARQGTLKGALDWSWELLTPAEQAALVQCSAFRGGFTLESAEQILDLSSCPDAPSALELLEALLGKSLLRTLSSTEPRFGMYESIREYAREKRGSIQREEVFSRHAAFYLTEGEALAARVESEEGPECLRLLALERENLLAVFHRFLSSSPETAIRAALCLQPLLHLRGPLSTQLSLLDAAADVAREGLPVLLRARLLLAHAWARWGRRPPDEIKSGLLLALSLAKEAKDSTLVGLALRRLGNTCQIQGRLDEAEEYYQKSLLALRQGKDACNEGISLNYLAFLQRERGKYAEAEKTCQKILSLLRGTTDPYTRGIVSGNFFVLRFQEGHLGEAEEYARAALIMLRARGDRRGLAISLGNLGVLCVEKGDDKEAEACYQEALSLLQGAGEPRAQGILLGNMGLLRMVQGHLEEAEEQYREALHLLREVEDRQMEGSLLLYQAALRASQGFLEEAEAEREAARERFFVRSQPLDLAAFELWSGYLDLARAKQARAHGDLKEEALHLEAVKARCRDAEAPGPKSEAYPQGGPSPSQRSSDIRLALRLLCRALDVFLQKEEDAREKQPKTPKNTPQDPKPQKDQPPEAPAHALVLHRQERWFRPPNGSPVDLSRRRAFRLIMETLAEHRLAKPGEALPLPALLSCGWPGERVHPEAGRSRVHMVISTLRSWGLKDVLLRRDDGYLLDPKLPLFLLE